MIPMNHNFTAEVRSLKVVHFAMVVGQVFFMAIVFFLAYTKELDINNADLNRVFIYLVPVIAAGGCIASIWMFRIRLKIAKSMSDLQVKLMAYRSALVIRYAIIEGVSIFAIVISLVTGKLLYLGIAGILILYFLALLPGIERIASDLELNPEEKQLLTK